MFKNLLKTVIRHIVKYFGYSLLNILCLTFGIVIAIPAAYYFMSDWLKNYVYKTNIGIPLIIGAALITIVITFITISYKAYQASVMNPANSIRND